MSDPRARMRELAAEYVRKGDQLSWFERLYQEGERGEAIVPWGDGTPNPHLVEFWQQHPLETGGKTALVIGSGFGDDAEQLAKWGFRTIGFDIAPSAIEQTKKRYPHSRVNYVLADLFDPPRAWIGAFDFVLEIYTIQSFVGDLRTKSIDAIARFVAPRGHLLVIARGRDESEPEVLGPPWPLTREELDGFQRAGLEVESFEDYAEHEPPWVRRFRVLYHRLNLSSRSRRDAIGGLNKSSLFVRFTSCSLGAPLGLRRKGLSGGLAHQKSADNRDCSTLSATQGGAIMSFGIAPAPLDEPAYTCGWLGRFGRESAWLR